MHTYKHSYTYVISDFSSSLYLFFFFQVDLVGGYYDAGDNVKFGLPMAFTITMLSWGVIEYGEQIATAGEYGHALEAIKWGTDYFIKAHTHPNVLWVEVTQKNLLQIYMSFPRASVESGIIPPGSPEIELNVREVSQWFQCFTLNFREGTHFSTVIGAWVTRGSIWG